MQFTKGSLGYLSSMYLSTSLVLGEVVDPFLEIDGWNSPQPFDSSLVRIQPRILLAPLLASSDKFLDTG